MVRYLFYTIGDLTYQSPLVYCLGNTSNGGMKCPVGLIQLTNVTRDPRSADWTEGTWRLPFNFNRIFVCLCCTIVMPVSSQLQSLAGLYWMVLFFGPCIFIIEGRTDQRNAQINFSLTNLLLFKLLRHVSATQLEPPSGSLKSLQVTSHCNLLGY